MSEEQSVTNLSSTFNKDKLLESYITYIKNYLNAKEAVNIAVRANSAFKLFLEQCQKENKEKQGLSDLMIKPVQRIPRYELIVKDLLKHTPEGHPDRSSLLFAQEELHELAVQMNKGEKEAEAADRHARLLQEIEQLIEGCAEISGTSKRKFLHQGICCEVKNGNRKDRSLWLFNDMIICSTSKKGGRSSSLRRSSMNLFSMTPDKVVVDFTCRYRFLWKFTLEEIDLMRGSIGSNQPSAERQLQQLHSDHELIQEIIGIANRIAVPHVQLDDAVRELLQSTNQRIIEKQHLTRQSLNLPGRLEISIPSSDGIKLVQFEFSTEDSKAQFEHSFWNAKESYITHQNKWEPAFLKAIPISKTRSGMQFLCAAPNTCTSPCNREVWVCITDNYVGQICFLAVDPELSQTQCLTVCNSKICCIAQVPMWERKLVSTDDHSNQNSKRSSQNRRPNRRSSSSNNLARYIISWDDSEESDEDNTSPTSPRSTNTSLSSMVFPGMSARRRKSANSANTKWGIDSDDEISPPYMSPLLRSLSLFRRFAFSDENIPASLSLPKSKKDMAGSELSPNDHSAARRITPNSLMHSRVGGEAYKKDNDGSTLHASLEDLLTEDTSSINGRRLLSTNGSMWLGTEDGNIKVFSTAQAMRSHNRHCQLNHNAAVQSILHHEGQVFVALSNGDLVVYHRNMLTGQWEFDDKKCISENSPHSPITKMIIVNGSELWCGCQNQMKIYDVRSHNLKSFFAVSQDQKRQIFCLTSSGFGVWIALDRRPHIKLFHSITHELITEIDVSLPVNKMLAGSDAIIRQHKAACLRITSLLVCKDLLWVGTSAGVVLKMATPSINASTSSLSLPIMPQGLPYGHTGHVRFLTTAESYEQESAGSQATSSGHRNSLITSASQTKPITLVISGGDGYEDFRMTSGSDVAGREDSTNHLLVWKV